jgi:hypothetical protein
MLVIATLCNEMIANVRLCNTGRNDQRSKRPPVFSSHLQVPRNSLAAGRKNAASRRTLASRVNAAETILGRLRGGCVRRCQARTSRTFHHCPGPCARRCKALHLVGAWNRRSARCWKCRNLAVDLISRNETGMASSVGSWSSPPTKSNSSAAEPKALCRGNSLIHSPKRVRLTLLHPVGAHSTDGDSACCLVDPVLP